MKKNQIEMGRPALPSRNGGQRVSAGTGTTGQPRVNLAHVAARKLPQNQKLSSRGRANKGIEAVITQNCKQLIKDTERDKDSVCLPNNFRKNYSADGEYFS